MYVPSLPAQSCHNSWSLHTRVPQNEIKKPNVPSSCAGCCEVSSFILNEVRCHNSWSLHTHVPQNEIKKPNVPSSCAACCEVSSVVLNRITVLYSFASMTPALSMPNVASASGSEGDAMIFAMRVSPRPFFTHMRVVVACAMILPPMGLIVGPANMEPPSRFAATTYIHTFPILEYIISHLPGSLR